MWGRRQVRREVVVIVGLRIGEFLVEVPGPDRHLSVLHEVPGQLAEYRLILETLRVDLAERHIPRRYADVKGAIRQAPLRSLVLRCARDGDGPVSLVRLVLVEDAEHVVDDFVRAALRHQAHLLRERMRVIGEGLVVDEPRVRRHTGVIEKECAVGEAPQAVGVVLKRRARGPVVGAGGRHGREPSVVADVQTRQVRVA